MWKRYGKYGGKVGWIVIRFGKILKIHKKIVKWYRKCGRKVGWIVKWYEKYGRKVSWKVKDMGNMKHGRKESWIVIRFGEHGRNLSWIVKRFGKYGRKLWNDVENLEEK